MARMLVLARRRIASLESVGAPGASPSANRPFYLLDYAADAILHGNPVGIILDASLAAEDVTGYPPAELKGKNIATLFSEIERKRVPLRYDLLKEGKIVRNERLLTRKDGAAIPIEMHTRMLPDGTYITLIRDVRPFKAVQESLEKSRVLLERVQRMARLGAWQIDLATNMVTASPEAHEIYGLPLGALTLAEIQTMPLPEYREALDHALEGLLRRGERYDAEFRIRRRSDGERRDIRSVAELDTATRTVFGSIQDITEIKEAGEILRRALKEKETLLQELYHRTKNNMHVLCALLELQAAHQGDPGVAQILRELSHRIAAMALVHQKLYQSKNLSSIQMREYVAELAQLVMAGYAATEGRVRLAIEGDDFPALIDTAIPCGLILTELITNALKHAWPADRPGVLTLRVSRDAERRVTLEVEDDGVGVPPGFDFRGQKSLGLTTVLALAGEQLGGEVHFESGPGVRCRIRFTDSRYQERI